MPVAATPPLTRSSRSITWAAHAAFLPIGMVTVLLGPMLPILAERWALTYSQSGYLFTAQFVGATVGVTVSGGAIRRLGYRAAMIMGLALTAAGTSTLPRLPFAGAIFAIALYGVAIGMMGPTCNLLVAHIHSDQRGAALNLLNFSWSIGAVSCPLLVAAAAHAGHTSLLLQTLAAVTFLIMVMVATIVPRGIGMQPQPLGGSQSASKLLWSRPGLFVLCALFSLYVGTENIVGGWLASYAKLSSSAVSTPIVTSSFFYFALMVGRLLAPAILKTMLETTLARIGLGIGILGTIGLVRGHTMASIVGNALLTGLGLSSVFPIVIAMLSRTFGPDSPRAAPVVFNMSNLGGASLPFLVGYTSEQLGSLRAGLGIAIITTGIMLGLFCFSVPFGFARERNHTG
ncbi:MAG TPA: MFS transporter [Terriglobales bacterium]|nr:MFS transporter [Terriglobales bacterium]